MSATTDKIRLVITDRYCINNHSTSLNKDLNFSIREVSLDWARHYIHGCDTYFKTFQITTDYMRGVYSSLLEGIPEKCSEEVFKIDDNTSFLVIALNTNGEVKFFLIMDNNLWEQSAQCKLN